MVVNTSYGSDLQRSDNFLISLRKLFSKSKNQLENQAITTIKVREMVITKKLSHLSHVCDLKSSLNTISAFLKNLQQEEKQELDIDVDKSWAAIKCHTAVEVKIFNFSIYQLTEIIYLQIAQLNLRELNLLRSRCNELHAVIRGKMLFSETLARAASDIARGKLPQQWLGDYFQGRANT